MLEINKKTLLSEMIIPNPLSESTCDSKCHYKVYFMGIWEHHCTLFSKKLEDRNKEECTSEAFRCESCKKSFKIS